MSEHHEDPVAHAGAKVTQYVSIATMAAEAIAQVAAARAAQRAAADERAAAAARAAVEAARGHARTQWAPMLDERTRAGADLRTTGTAWAAAQAWRPDPEAERVTNLAEDRLRGLRPDVMERYDRLRADGVDPVDAMRRVAPFFDREQVHDAGPAVQRDALAAQSSTHDDRAAGAAGAAGAADTVAVTEAVVTGVEAAAAAVDERLERTAASLADIATSTPDQGTSELGDESAVAAAEVAQRHGRERLGEYLRDTAVIDDPSTVRVDEHQDAVTGARPERVAAEADFSRAASLPSSATTATGQGSAPGAASATPPAGRTGPRTQPEVVAADFPQRVNATGHQAARGAATHTTAAATQKAATRASTTVRQPSR